MRALPAANEVSEDQDVPRSRSDRRHVVIVAVALLSAGCVVPGLTQTDVPVDLDLGELPEGAVVETIEGGLRLVLDAVDLPFEQNITIPVGTTLVRATGIVGDEESVGVSLRHAETERRRCNLAPVDAWDVPILGKSTCSGVTLVDALPAVWTVRVTSPLTDAGRVEIDLLTTPVDGILAQLDVSQLSMHAYEPGETEILRVPSFDGTELHVEVTLPEGPGPWPTVIWSSPYSHLDRLGSGKPAAWGYWVHDWVKRGYAAVSADVRGYGYSDGCVEVWSTNEQKDQAFLVDWVADQEWSDGNVGFYGQSYVATTPVAAAVQAPEALKAIIAVAPVNNAYDDWHFGGVPNGEGVGSPVGYQETGANFGPLGLVGVDPTGVPGEAEYWLDRVDNGYCDPTLTLRANDPRAIYDAFYEERNFSARAGDIKAAVLYTQGFEDSNVKSAMIPDWFNAIQAPKLGLFGHWVHQHPTRADNEALMLLWLDQYLKGKPVGFDKLPPVRVLTNDGQERVADLWPPAAGDPFTLALDPANGALTSEAGEGSATILMDSARGTLPVSLADLPLGLTELTLTSEPLSEPVHFAGYGNVHLAATLQHAQNAYVAAELYEETADGERALVTWGMFNLAHRNGHDGYEPVAPGERVQVVVPLLPTEWVLRAGSTLHLVLRSAQVQEWFLTPPTEPGALDVYAEGSALELAIVPEGVAMPTTAQR